MRTSAKDDLPPPPPASHTDLAGILGQVAYSGAFAETSIRDAYQRRLAGSTGAVYLLPRGEGWVAQVWTEGKTLQEVPLRVERRGELVVVVGAG